MEILEREADNLTHLATKPAAITAEPHCLTIQAACALLTDMEWTAKQHQSFDLDVARHGRVATLALRTFAKRQKTVRDSEIARNESEYAGEAMGRQLDALLALGLIHEASTNADIDLSTPPPSHCSRS